MLHDDAWNDARTERIEAALGATARRRMTAREVAARLVAEIDGDIAARDGNRVWAVERMLAACDWRGLPVARLERVALSALESWDASRGRLDVELARILGRRP